ncbi:MAG: inositol monophosphatase family protein [Alphaproteobacteria bacterium]|nr:inositol monophosphatase family protein [Alphaproteobacteria bacterium]
MSGPHSDRAAAEAFLAELPSVSRAVISQYFRQSFAIDNKADDSPVTIADRAAEAALRQSISAAFPGHAIMGEEQGGHVDEGLSWIIDPIDGTRSFITGRPLFGTLIGIVDGGIPVSGLIDMPAINETYRTEDGRSLFESAAGTVAIRSRSCDRLEDAHIATTSPDAFTAEGWQAFTSVKDKCASSVYGGDCYNYALLAAGHLDIVIEHQLGAYDMMALVPILQNAGAYVTDWQGAPITINNDGSLLACATRALHQDALKCLHSSQAQR